MDKDFPTPSRPPCSSPGLIFLPWERQEPLLTETSSVLSPCKIYLYAY